MRLLIRFVLASGATIAAVDQAAASACYWINAHIYCDPGCHVTQRWWDGYQQWMQYWCGPPPELILAGAVVALGLVAVGIVGAIRAAPRRAAFSQEIQEADAKAAEAERITNRLKAAAAEADQFIQTYRR